MTPEPGPHASLFRGLHLDGPVVVESEPSADAALRRLARSLPQDGLGIVKVATARRWQAQRAARAQGFVARGAFLTFPRGVAPERIVARDRHVLAYAVDDRKPARRLAQTLLQAVPAAALVADGLPLAVAVQRPGAPFGRRLRSLVPGADPDRVVVSRSSAVMLTTWGSSGRTPLGYVKLGDVAGEADALRRLRFDAEHAGARLPRILGSHGQALALAPLAGRSAARVLADDHGRVLEVLGRICSWLERWNVRARRHRILGTAELNSLVLRHVDALTDHLPPAYVAFIRAAAVALEGQPVALAPAHRDLTMANVLLDGPHLGVLDWEAARGSDLPLIDMPYAMADAVSTLDAHADRVAAFVRCFARPPASPSWSACRSMLSESATRSGARQDLLSLAFHACWLSHAADDLRRSGADGPFVGIARVLASDPRRYDPFLT